MQAPLPIAEPETFGGSAHDELIRTAAVTPDGGPMRELLDAWRSRIAFGDYQGDGALRALLNRTQRDNPALPPRLLAWADRSGPAPQGSFLDQWRTVNPDAPVTTLTIDVANFVNILRAVPAVFGSLSDGLLHDDNYFFEKSLEWYLSYRLVTEHGYRTVLDLESNNLLFGEMLTTLCPDVGVMAADLALPHGVRMVGARLSTLGTDAGRLAALADESVDFVCMHNAFEHFEGDSDRSCIAEVLRVLRPGGRALIVPFYHRLASTILINPVSAFYLRGDSHYADLLDREPAENGTRLELTAGMISPYARFYDAALARRRILAAAQAAQVSLLHLVPSTVGSGDSPSVYGRRLSRTIFADARLTALEIHKPPSRQTVGDSRASLTSGATAAPSGPLERWSADGAQILPIDASRMPAGSSEAFRIAEDGAASVHKADTVVTLNGPAGCLRFAVLARADGRDHMGLWLRDATNPEALVEVFFDVGKGQVTSCQTYGQARDAKALMIPVGDGWFRCVLLGVPADTARTLRASILVRDTATGSSRYQGESGRGLLIADPVVDAATASDLAAAAGAP